MKLTDLKKNCTKILHLIEDFDSAQKECANLIQRLVDESEKPYTESFLFDSEDFYDKQIRHKIQEINIIRSEIETTKKLIK